MKRPRPAIPVAVRFEVAKRQLLPFLASYTPVAQHYEDVLAQLAAHLGCDRRDLRLDHDPALRTRAYNPRVKKIAARYSPNANDPNYLIWRTAHAHHIKTNVCGDGAQHPDRVLIKKARRQERGPKPKKHSQKWPKRKLQSRSSWPVKERK